jgi:molybdopterin-guanine dinucleotide biosynthesis protein A
VPTDAGVRRSRLLTFVSVEEGKGRRDEALPRLGAIVLAGGRSTRMGRDKASIPFDGTTLLGRVVATLATVVDELLVVVRAGQALPPLPAVAAPVRIVFDEVEDRGPLAGLATGLASLAAPIAYVSSCDAPLLVPDFVRAMCAALRDADVAMPEVDGRLHPLAGVYRRDPTLAAARGLLARGRLRPVFLLETLVGVRVQAARLRAADPELRSLENVNTPEDLERARGRVGR